MTNYCVTDQKIIAAYLIRKPSRYMVKKYGYDEAQRMAIKKYGIAKMPIEPVSNPNNQ